MSVVPPGAKEAYAQFGDTHTWTAEEIGEFFEVDIQKGLSDEQVQRNQERFGKNEFPPEEGTSLWMLILKQFEDTLVIILIVAALISFVLAFFEEDPDERFTAFVEPLVIVVILVANATVGVLQESSAEKAVEALKQYEVSHANVIRNGHITTLSAEELVPGDVVEVEVGQQVPADIRLVVLRSSALDVDQALLTGESDNVGKNAKPLDKKKYADCQIQDKKNFLFSGSNVVRGKGVGIVINTGTFTEKGKIRQALQKHEEDDEAFPLKQRLDQFGNQLSITIGILCLAVWLINIPHFSDAAFDGVLRGAIYYFKIAISLAVAAIPEGLPAVVTTCLALGTQRMAKKNAIVRALPAVETLGCTSVICSDKTGTLTTNQMSVQQFLTVDSKGKLSEYVVEGTTFAPQKEDGSCYSITGDAGKLKPGQLVEENLTVLQSMAVLSVCNDASIAYKDTEDRYVAIGQSTEAAMKVFVEKVGAPGTNWDKVSKLPAVDRALFCNRVCCTFSSLIFSFKVVC